MVRKDTWYEMTWQLHVLSWHRHVASALACALYHRVRVVCQPGVYPRHLRADLRKNWMGHRCSVAFPMHQIPNPFVSESLPSLVSIEFGYSLCHDVLMSWNSTSKLKWSKIIMRMRWQTHWCIGRVFVALRNQHRHTAVKYEIPPVGDAPNQNFWSSVRMTLTFEHRISNIERSET